MSLQYVDPLAMGNKSLGFIEDVMDVTLVYQFTFFNLKLFNSDVCLDQVDCLIKDWISMNYTWYNNAINVPQECSSELQWFPYVSIALYWNHYTTNCNTYDMLIT